MYLCAGKCMCFYAYSKHTVFEMPKWRKYTNPHSRCFGISQKIAHLIAVKILICKFSKQESTPYSMSG